MLTKSDLFLPTFPSFIKYRISDKLLGKQPTYQIFLHRLRFNILYEITNARVKDKISESVEIHIMITTAHSNQRDEKDRWKVRKTRPWEKKDDCNGVISFGNNKNHFLSDHKASHLQIIIPSISSEASETNLQDLSSRSRSAQVSIVPVDNYHTKYEPEKKNRLEETAVQQHLFVHQISSLESDNQDEFHPTPLHANTRKKRNYLSLSSSPTAQKSCRPKIYVSHEKDTFQTTCSVSLDLSSGALEIAKINDKRDTCSNEIDLDDTRPQNPMASVFLFIGDEHKYLQKTKKEFMIDIERPSSPMSEVTISPSLQVIDLDTDVVGEKDELENTPCDTPQNIILPQLTLDDAISEVDAAWANCAES